jgi:phosphoglycolate phosphatase
VAHKLKAIIFDYDGTLRDNTMPTVGTYPDTADILKRLQKDYRIGLVTAAKDARADLKHLQIEQYFEIVIGAEDFREHKPDPEGINLALHKLDISADEAVYIGDTSTDIYTTKAAKLKAAIGVTTGFANRRELETAGADHIIDSLTELPAVLANIEQ